MTDDLRRQLQQAVGTAGPAPLAAITARGGRLARRRQVRTGVGAALAGLIVAGGTLVATQRGKGDSVRVAVTPPARRVLADRTTTSTSAESTTTTTPTAFVPRSIPAVAGDVDGDGKSDRITVTWSLNNTTATVVADMTRLGRQTVTVPVSSWLVSPNGFDRPAILGVADLAHDGYGEILVQTDHGASTVMFTILRLIGGRLTPITLDGQPVGLQVTGSWGHPATIGCLGGDLTQNLTTNAGAAYDGERDVYAFEGARLVLVAKSTHTFATANPPTDAQYAAAGWQDHCPPLD